MGQDVFAHMLALASVAYMTYGCFVCCPAQIEGVATPETNVAIEINMVTKTNQVVHLSGGAMDALRVRSEVQTTVTPLACHGHATDMLLTGADAFHS